MWVDGRVEGHPGEGGIGCAAADAALHLRPTGKPVVEQSEDAELVRACCQAEEELS